MPPNGLRLKKRNKAMGIPSARFILLLLVVAAGVLGSAAASSRPAATSVQLLQRQMKGRGSIRRRKGGRNRLHHRRRRRRRSGRNRLGTSNSKKKTSNSSPYSCDEGCDLSRGRSVCGDDGITYLNECLAICQDVDVAYQGECMSTTTEEQEHVPVPAALSAASRGGSSPLESRTYGAAAGPAPPVESPDTFVRAGRVSTGVLNRFKDKGFKYVGKRERLPFNGDEEFNPDESDGILNNGSAGISPPQPVTLRAVRLTSDGDEYVSGEEIAPPTNAKVGVRPSDVEARSSASGSDHDLRKGRILTLIGADTRSRVSPTTVWPMNLVGSFRPDGYIGGCTGTVISMTSILTAAHCVYSYDKKQWTNMDIFSPGMYKSSSGRFVEPYGTFEMESVAIYSAYVDHKHADYDFAIVKLKPLNGKNIGEVNGYAGIRYTDAFSSFLQNSMVAGYPDDKGLGDMWTSGGCAGTYRRQSVHSRYESDLRIYHECDTRPGNSGSSLMDADGYVHGVHFAAYTGKQNIANLLTLTHYDKLKEWGGRTGSDEPYRPSSPERTTLVDYEIIFQYDSSPGETSWNVKDTATGNRVASIPARRSRQFPPKERVTMKVNFIPGRQYQINMRDSRGNGFWSRRSAGRGFIMILGKRGGATVFRKRVAGRFKRRRSVKFTMPEV